MGWLVFEFKPLNHPNTIDESLDLTQEYPCLEE
jgi:hypothetical protein